METRYSAVAQQALGEVWRELIEAGAGAPALEFYDGAMPATPDDKLTGQRLLARLPVKPVTLRAKWAKAVRSGDVTWARVVGADGRAVMDVDVSTRRGDGALTFNTTEFRLGGPVTFNGRLGFFNQRGREDDDEDE